MAGGASDPFAAAAAAVSALCWVPQGSAAAQPRSYLLEAQDRHALGTRLKQQLQQQRRQLQTPRRTAAGSLRTGKNHEGQQGRRGRGRETAAAAAAPSEMEVDEDEEEGEEQQQDEQEEAAAGRGRTSDDESMEAAEGDEEENDDSEYLFGVVKEDGPATLNDPYLNLDEGEDSEEEEANRVLPTDLLLVAANAEYDCSSLEVYVYDEEAGSFYVHHDILTGGYPLCLEWLNTCPHAAGGPSSAADPSKRNLVASGSFDPEISLWDLDVLDRIDAVCTLGGEPRLTAGRPAARRVSKNKKKKQQSATAAAPSTTQQQGHEGPVMTLHKAPTKGHVLASGSADESVKLWDLTTAACVHTYNHHTNKVQAVRWHPTQEAALLTTGYDRRAAVLDVRSPQDIVYAPSLSADAESCVWDRHHPFTFWVSTEDGCVACYDVRRLKGGKDRDRSGGQQRGGTDQSSLLWRIYAHKQAVSGVTDSGIPDLMVTCGVDGDSKLWNVSPESGVSGDSSSSTDGSGSDGNALARRCQPEQPPAVGPCTPPTLIFERALKAGPLYCCSSNEDTPHVLGFGGNCVVVWDITDTEHVKRVFRLK